MRLTLLGAVHKMNIIHTNHMDATCGVLDVSKFSFRSRKLFQTHLQTHDTRSKIGGMREQAQMNWDQEQINQQDGAQNVDVSTPTLPDHNSLEHMISKYQQRESEKVTYAGQSDADWPIRVRKFVPQKFRQETITDSWKTTGWSTLGLVVIPAVIVYFFPNPSLIFFWVLLILMYIWILFQSWSTTLRDIRKLSLARESYVIGRKEILNAYRNQGLRQIALLPSTLALSSRDGGEDGWYEESYPVHSFWFYDDGQKHSYVLFWRNVDYYDRAGDPKDFYQVASDLNNSEVMNGREYRKRMKAELEKRRKKSITEKTDDLRKSLGKFGSRMNTLPAEQVASMLRDFDGTDIRMQPCVLEIEGLKARLILDPNAPKLSHSQAHVDANIRPGGKYPTRLMDTFSPQEQREEWKRAQRHRDAPLYQW